MRKKNIMINILTFLFVIGLLSLTQSVSGATYPYSVSIGDKISYKVDILKNGTTSQPLYVYGLNLTEGDVFEMEIFDGVASSDSYSGIDFKIRFHKGDMVGPVVSGSSYLYTSDVVFWQTYSNTTIDISGQVYQLTNLNESITYSWTQDADNLIKISFTPKDGLLTSFERKTTSTSYSYTHFKFTKGSGSIPGYEIQTAIFSLFFFAVIVHFIRKNKIV